MKRIVLIGLFLLHLFQSFAQNQSDSIEIKKGFATVFRQHGKKLTLQQLLDITKINTEAYAEMQIAMRNYTIDNILGFAGGFMIGWPIGTAIGGGKPNWALAGIGAGLAVMSVPFDIAFTKHAKNAAKIYNAGLKLENIVVRNDSTPSVSTNAKHSLDLLSVLYYISTDSSYQNYISRLQSLLKQDIKTISYEYREYKYGNGKIKFRGLKAKHKYGINKDYSYKVGTWEYYSKDGKLQKTVNYNLKEEIVK